MLPQERNLQKKEKPDFVWEDNACPKCKEHSIIKGKTAYGCSDFKNCGFKIPFEIYGKKLTEKQMQDLVLKRKTSKLKGFAENPWNLSEGILSFDELFNMVIS